MDYYLSLILLFTSLQLSDAITYLGSPAIWREHEDSVKRAIFVVDPSQQVAAPGIITGWHVYTIRGRRSQMAHLQVWRKENPEEKSSQKAIRAGATDIYKMVGQTVFVAHWVGHNYFPLYPTDRITVEPGDVFAVYFPKYNPIPWNSVPCRDGNEHLFKYNPRHLRVGMELRFEKANSDWKPCRQYSFNATIVSPDELESFEAEAMTFADNRGLHGQYRPTKTPITSVAMETYHVTFHCFMTLISCIFFSFTLVV